MGNEITLTADRLRQIVQLLDTARDVLAEPSAEWPESGQWFADCSAMCESLHEVLLKAAEPVLLVEINGEPLNLYDARQADRFLAHVVTLAGATRLGLEKEFILAERIVSAWRTEQDFGKDGLE